MNQRLIQALENHPDQYILPFFWQHGEDAALLREGMQRIRESGIGAVCIESRPHPDFLGEKWWHDLDTILDEAKRLEMKSGFSMTRIFLPACAMEKSRQILRMEKIISPMSIPTSPDH